MAQDLLQEGIAAFQAGDRDRARELFLQVTQSEPTNEKAWYYLAVSESDTALRQTYLERVLLINPNNARAKEVLERLKARQTEPAPEPTPTAVPSRPPSSPRIRPISPEAASHSRSPATGGGFALPFTIPGAPARITFDELAQDGIALLRGAFRTFSRTPGIFAAEVNRANWWRFWLLVGTAAVVTALVVLATVLILILRFMGIVSPLLIVLTPLLAIPIIVAMLLGGVYASYRWAAMHGGSASLVRHAYGVALRWMPIVLAQAAFALILTLLDVRADMTTILMLLYALIMVGDGFETLYLFRENNQRWITAGIMILTAVLIGIVIRLVLLGVIPAGIVPFVIG
jgi:hypothetical protein